MNRHLAKAILETFQQDDTEVIRKRFTPFGERDWQRCTTWLHTSGLALYFFDRAKRVGILDAIPDRLRADLEENCEQNRTRTEAMFNEFVEVNMQLQRAKLCYANLKGFTLPPRSCPDPALRYQHDLDFLVAQRDAEECRSVLAKLGYQRSAVFGDTWEFRAGPAEAGSLRKLYKVRSQRSLELHLVPDTEEGESDRRTGQLSRLQLQVWNGFEFPALSEIDKLLGQALHLFKHFQTEWTRTAWMLEYANAIRSHLSDASFWLDAVAAVNTAAPEKRIGIGVGTLVASSAFGIAPPAQFLDCTVARIPEPVRLWANHYHDELVFIEFPGSKLYLLLQDVLLAGQPDWPSQRRRKLLPSRLPANAIMVERGDLRQQTKTVSTRLRFVWSRLRFHIAAGLRYKIEAMRWKKFVAGYQP